MKDKRIDPEKMYPSGYNAGAIAALLGMSGIGSYYSNVIEDLIQEMKHLPIEETIKNKIKNIWKL